MAGQLEMRATERWACAPAARRAPIRFDQALAAENRAARQSETITPARGFDQYLADTRLAARSTQFHSNGSAAPAATPAERSTAAAAQLAKAGSHATAPAGCDAGSTSSAGTRATLRRMLDLGPKVVPTGRLVDLMV